MPFPRRWLRAVLAICAALASFEVLRANPVGPQVVRGNVSFDGSIPSQLGIHQGSDRAVIDWRSFSIAPGEITQFFQPGTRSAVLNRVRGNESSLLDGSLLANGSVFLLNPNGIVVGKNGRIDAGGFVASSLDLDPDEFLKGRDLQFRGASQASVVNQGQIYAAAGDVFLIAPQVSNEGSIRAPSGTAGLAAGNDVLLTEAGEERVFVRGASGSRKEVGVDQRGAIEASRAELKAHGGNLYALAIRNQGRVAATGVSRRGGQIYLSANGGKIRSAGSLRARNSERGGGTVKIAAGVGSEAKVELEGSIDASGEVGRGGRVEVSGETVELGSSASVTANGPEGGGEILIGRDHWGPDSLISNAKSVTVSQGARLEANAMERGDGGRVILFSDGHLDFAGQLSARGGVEAGRGGFVELSGSQSVAIPDLTGQVDLRAPQGTPGTLLLDPVHLSVVHGAGGIVWGTTISDGAINDFLANNGSLILDSSALGPDEGDIQIDPGVAISWNSASDLTFHAFRDFGMAAGSAVAALGDGSVSIHAGRSASVSGSISTIGGSIDLFANQAENPLLGNFHGIVLEGSLHSGTGAIHLKGTGGDGPGNHGVLVTGGIASLGTGETAGPILLEGAGRSSDDQGDGLVIGGTLSTVDGNLVLKGSSAGGSGVRIQGTSTAFAGTGMITIDGNGATTDLKFEGCAVIGEVGMTGDIILNGDTIDLSNTAVLRSGGNLRILPRTAATSIGVGDGAAGTLNLTADEIGAFKQGFASIVIGDTAAGSGAIVANAVTFLDPVTIAAPAAGGSITVNGPLTNTGGSITLATSWNPVALNANVVTAGSPITLQGGIVLGANVTLDTTLGGLVPTGGNVEVTGSINADCAPLFREFGIDAGTSGAISLAGAIGDAQPLSRFKLTGASVALSSTVSGLGNVELWTDELILGGAILSPGVLTIAPQTAGTTIGLGDGTAGALHLSTAQLGYLQGGFSEIRVGSEGVVPGAVDIQGGEFASDLTVRGTSIGVTGLAAGEHQVTLLASNGGISNTGGTATSIAAGTVRLKASGNIGFGGSPVRLGAGAAVSAEAGAGIFLAGAGDLTIGLAGGTAGLCSLTGDIEVDAKGLLRIAQPVQSAGNQWFQGAAIRSESELVTTGGRTTLAIDDRGEDEGGFVDVRANVRARDGLFLRGGGGNDRFCFSLLPDSFPQPLTGEGYEGRGYDVLDFSQVGPGTPLDFDLAAKPWLVDGIDHVIGTQDGRDRVILPSFGAGIDVDLTGLNQFEAGQGEKTFTSFEYVTGSCDPDLFTFHPGGLLTGGIDGSGGNDVIQGTSLADTFEIAGNQAGTARGTPFVSIERILGGAGDDRFNFRNQATLLGGIDGNSGTDAMLIDDSNLLTAQTYRIADGIVTRNPVYLFGGIESLTLLAGRGNDDITTNFQAFSQQISGGPGIDTIHVKSAVSTVSPLRLPGYREIRFAGIEEVDAGALPKIDDLVGRSGDGQGAGNVGNGGGEITNQFGGSGGGGGPNLMGAPGSVGGGLGSLAGVVPGGTLPAGDVLQAALMGVNSLVARNFGIVSFNGGPPPSPKIRNEILNNIRNFSQSELSLATTLGGMIQVDTTEGVSPMSSGGSDAIGQAGLSSLEFSVSLGALAELGASLGLPDATGVGRFEGTVSFVPGDPFPRPATQSAMTDALTAQSFSLLSLAIGGNGTVTLDPADGLLAANISVDLPGAPALVDLQGNTSLGALMELVRVFGGSGETSLSGESGPVTLDVSGIPPSAQLRIRLQVSNGVLAQYLLLSALGMSAESSAGPGDGAFQLDCSGSDLSPGQQSDLSNQLTSEARNELEGSFWQR